MLHALDAVLGPAYFWLFAIAALACGSGVLVSRHPLNAAVCLVGVMLSLAGIYALLGSPFLGVLQVLTYAGAIMMLVVFVIMVLNQARDRQTPRQDWLSLAVAPIPVALGLLLAVRLSGTHLAASAQSPRAEAPVVAARLFDTSAGGPGLWLLFLLVGVMLLVAVVAAVMLAKRRLDDDGDAAAEAGHD